RQTRRTRAKVDRDLGAPAGFDLDREGRLIRSLGLARGGWRFGSKRCGRGGGGRRGGGNPGAAPPPGPAPRRGTPPRPPGAPPARGALPGGPPLHPPPPIGSHIMARSVAWKNIPPMRCCMSSTGGAPPPPYGAHIMRATFCPCRMYSPSTR